MNDSDQEPDLFTEALRLDLPNDDDQARVRTRLVSAGVLAGAGVVAPSAAAAATASSGLFAKIAALPLALKVGASVVAVGVATVPVLDRVSDSRHAGPARAHTPAALVAVPVPVPARVVRDEGRAEQPRVEPAVAAIEVAASEVDAPRPSAPRSVSGAAALPLPAAEATPASAPLSTSLPAVGSFPAVEAKPIDEGTLRAETALMERALAAIKRGDLVTARRELATHAAKFPDGHLKPERERALERTLGKNKP